MNPMKAYPTPEVGTNGEAILKAPSKVLTRYGQIDVLLKTQGENIFEEIRKAAIDEIQGDSKEARNLRSRLEKVKLHTLMPGTAVHDEECLSNGIPRIGAFFSERTYSISICPALLNSPEPMLVSTLAHELMHAIDPCTVKGPLYEVRAAKNKSEKERLANLVNDIPDSGLTQPPQVNLPVGFDGGFYSKEKNFERYEKMGILNRSIDPLEKAYPFQNLASCLYKQGNTPTKQAVKYFAEHIGRDIQKFESSILEADPSGPEGKESAKHDLILRPLTPKQKKAAREQAKVEKRYVDRAQGWLKDRIICYSSLSEDFSDRMASHIVGKMKNRSFDTALDRLALTSLFSSMACRGAVPHARYSEDQRRVVFWMNDPGIAKKLGCKPARPLCPVNQNPVAGEIPHSGGSIR